jgi:putative endonuclease
VASQQKGCRILDHRDRTPACEIDLAARKGRMPVFVEAKARRTQDMALESVTPQLRKRLEQAASEWVSRRRGLQQQLWRLDMVMLAPAKLPRRMRDAWRAQG